MHTPSPNPLWAVVDDQPQFAGCDDDTSYIYKSTRHTNYNVSPYTNQHETGTVTKHQCRRSPSSELEYKYMRTSTVMPHMSEQSTILSVIQPAVVHATQYTDLLATDKRSGYVGSASRRRGGKCPVDYRTSRGPGHPPARCPKRLTSSIPFGFRFRFQN